ncbi:fluoroquinolone export ABC transporter permease subunit [Natronospora cellulosivora (SeqCode)]
MRILQALKQDLKYQFRHGFYYAYIFVSLIYIAIIFFVPSDYRALVAGIIVFSDPAMLGFFFIGAIVLLEKGENIFEGLFVTPLKVNEFLAARVLSLCILALFTAFIIGIIAIGFNFNYLLLFAALFLTSIIFTLLGVTLAVRVKTVNEFLIYSIFYSVIIAVPILEFVNIYENIIFYIWPTRASLLLILGSFTRNTELLEILFSIFVLILWTIIAYKWAYTCFYTYIILKIGDQE